MSNEDLKKLSKLGQSVPMPSDPNDKILERVHNPHKKTLYNIRLTAPEFTSLCPVTGQPDFAYIIIDYIPKSFLVESKSFKLFLNSFRNHQAFHEDCTIFIAKKLVKLLTPIWLRIGGYWYPRGGIPIDIFWQTKNPPKDVWIPSQNVPLYGGRG